MISDDELYRLAIFLGSCAMMMIVLYHFLDVNASDEEVDSAKTGESATVASSAASPSAESAGASAAAQGS
ncbi:Oligosaccaryltransferase [Penicillium lagena]|uniref:Oligosaccaryltransferase n=1 Tax=Penicillium lagena TaxID=94218 RepID=UPI0025402AA3|nr:Oligosaccaryltransferase [Penicillium lagena]KAJ5611326.1 Oligosaccaryltransferase [Penicillium lagena]